MARIICDAYSQNKQIFGNDIHNPLNQRILAVNNMYRWLHENGILEKESFILKGYPKGIAFAVDVAKLLPYRKEMENCQVPGAALAVRHIFDESYTPCMYSGTIQPGGVMSTYRDVDGCVDKSWECDLIKGLNTETIYEVNRIKEEQGIQAAVKALFGCYIWSEPEKKPPLSSQIDAAASKVDSGAKSKNDPELDPSR